MPQLCDGKLIETLGLAILFVVQPVAKRSAAAAPAPLMDATMTALFEEHRDWAEGSASPTLRIDRTRHSSDNLPSITTLNPSVSNTAASGVRSPIFVEPGILHAIMYDRHVVHYKNRQSL